MRMRAPGSRASEVPERLSIVIGNSDHVGCASEIACMINEAYGRDRTTAREITNRLRAGDELTPNRVLHVAYRDDRTVVGCVSSTPHWNGDCGQWGFLAVAVAEQGNGVATELVSAAERRLMEHGCTQVQIEYMLKPCDSDGRKLHAWYSRLGFETTFGGCWIALCCCVCISCWNCQPATFRVCRKALVQGDLSKPECM